FQDLDVVRYFHVSRRSDLDFRIAALRLQRRQPTDLELQADGDQQISFLQLQKKARLRFDEVWVLVALGDGVDGNAIAAHLAPDRSEIFGRGDNVELRRG